VLGTFFCDIHPIEFFDKIAFSKDGTDNSEPAAWNDPFIGKLYANFFGFLIALLYQESKQESSVFV